MNTLKEEYEKSVNETLERGSISSIQLEESFNNVLPVPKQTDPIEVQLAQYRDRLTAISMYRKVQHTY